MGRTAGAFVVRHTSLRSVPGLESVRLHLADDALTLWRAVQIETADPETPLPYWAFAWAGGLAVARYLQERPGTVAGKRVLDLAAGSGLCGIVAMQVGAAAVTAVDVDPFAVAVIPRNARANDVRLSVAGHDILDSEPPDVDVVLAGDCWYEQGLAARVLPWLRRAQATGIAVIVGDPDRRYLPVDALVELATYAVRTTTELEDLAQKRARVFALRPPTEVGVDVSSSSRRTP
jgi:predicted nicotinamide N-methyase